MMDYMIWILSVAVLLISVVRCLIEMNDTFVYRKQSKQERKMIDNIIDKHSAKEILFEIEYKALKKSDSMAQHELDRENKSREMVRNLYNESISALYDFLSKLYDEKVKFMVSVKIVLGTNEIPSTNTNLKNCVATYCSVPDGEDGLRVDKIEQVNSSSEYQFLYDGGKEFFVTDLDGYRKKASYVNSDKAFTEKYQTSIAFPLRCPANEKSNLGCEGNDLIGVLCIYAVKPLMNYRKNRQILDVCRYTARALSRSLARHYDSICCDILKRETIFSAGINRSTNCVTLEEKADVASGKTIENDGYRSVVRREDANKLKMSILVDGERAGGIKHPRHAYARGNKVKCKGIVRAYSGKRREDSKRRDTFLPGNKAAGSISKITGKEKGRRKSAETETK